MAQYPTLIQIAVPADDSKPLLVSMNGKPFTCSCGNDPVAIYLTNDNEIVAYCDDCLPTDDDCDQ
jgi:hypothetical protein